jgi:hypothetical protein
MGNYTGHAYISHEWAGNLIPASCQRDYKWKEKTFQPVTTLINQPKGRFVPIHISDILLFKYTIIEMATHGKLYPYMT